MMERFSVKENKGDAFKMLPNQEKVHECGRGEVASFVFRINPMSHVTFFPFLD
jgi:hypothetical protein